MSHEENACTPHQIVGIESCFSFLFQRRFFTGRIGLRFSKFKFQKLDKRIQILNSGIFFKLFKVQ